MKYRVLWERNCKDLENEVEKALALGWVLQGGVSLTVSDGLYYFAQAVVKPS